MAQLVAGEGVKAVRAITVAMMPIGMLVSYAHTEAQPSCSRMVKVKRHRKMWSGQR